MTDWLKEAQLIQSEIIQNCRHFHMFPEVGRNVEKTAEYIEEKLHSYGISTRRCFQTGIVGTLKGKQEGHCVMFRSDMDALPIEEMTGLDYASRNQGMMHACGHDMHMAALLGCAHMLAGHADQVNGTVLFLFEPDEEGDGGAQEMIREGVLDHPHVDAVFGAHCNPDLKAGEIGIKYDAFYASAATVDITIHGHGSHGAEPEKGTDSLYAGALIAAALKEMTHGDGDDRLVVSIGEFHSGTARNIIPDATVLKGIIRTCGIEQREQAMAKARNIIFQIARETGTQADVEIHAGYPGVANHPDETGFVQTAAEKLLGKENVIVETNPTMTTEDFGYFLLERPGCFYHIGVGPTYGLHNARFCPNEKALPVAAAVHAAVLTEWLKKE